MKIKRIDICGFKSFVDKTIISFPDPITSIVGPNGCGKSNVVDAIRWVMGEQSAKHLRGRAMEDVIFAGSESRGPAGFAEVSLTFDALGLGVDAAPGGVPWGLAAPEDIVVTRRLYRDGDSEYLLNGVPSRLRDVVEFFLGTGVGSKAYAIIEQGRIGFIVSSRPEDRRGLIDEAAGITRYKAKKKSAERRMDSTRQHLLRVSDVVTEIEGRLRSLRLAAQKAERYKRYKAELRDLDLWSSAQRYLGHLAEEKSAHAELVDVRELHDTQATALAAGEAAVEVERLAVSEETAELAAAKDDLFALSNKAQLGMQRSAHQEAEAAGLRSRAAAGAREAEELRARAVIRAADIDEIQNRLAEIESDAERRGQEHDEEAAVQEERRQALSEARRALEAALSEMGSATAKIARIEAERAAAEHRREDLRGRLDGLAGEDSAASERLAALLAEETTLREQVETIAERVEAARQKVIDDEAALTTVRAELGRGELELETLREEAHRRRSRLASLREIQERYERFQSGVRAIMREHQQGQGARGVEGLVADIMRPPPELETAVEAVLGERLGNVIVESHEAGIEAIQFLKRQSEGRSSFIPRALRPTRGEVLYDASGGASGAAAGDAPLPLVDPAAVSDVWPQAEGVRGRMLDLIGYDHKYDAVATYLLGDVLVVEDLEKALALWRETRTDKTIVTLEGEVIDPHGVVTGGSRDTALAGLLEQRREIRELEAVMERLDADVEAALAKHVERKQTAADLTRSRDEAAAALRTDEMSLLGQRKDLERLVDERRRLESRRAALAAQSLDLARAAEESDARVSKAAGELETIRAAQEEAEHRAGELRIQTVALADEVDRGVGVLTTLKIAATQATERRQNARQTLDRLLNDQSQDQARSARLDATTQEDLARGESLAAQAVELRREAELAQAEAEALARAHGERQGALETRSGALAAREAELRAVRAEVARLSQLASRLELRAQEAAMRRASIEEQIADRYRDVVLGGVVVDYHLRPLFGAAEEQRATELRGLIDRMGEINLTAIEESEELQKRYDFLTAQRTDLESAVAQLETAIDKINKASRKRFRETFDAVNAEFQAMFPRLFGGGHAKLALTDENDMLETGIDIIANPPGKKVSQNIELLSGGEKALTAVSLLFAIFLVKPSPFCVLDEVDAPLDEANVGRFNQVVREMTDRSQFIIITHNRRTMEIADRLCGVTMEEPGVSKLVAVNLRNGANGRVGRAQVVTEPAPAQA